MKKSAAVASLVLLVGCSQAAPSVTGEPSGSPSATPVDGGTQASPDPNTPSGDIPPSPQRPGDPVRGYDAVVNHGYIPCGIPKALYDFLGGSQSIPLISGQFVGAEERALTIPGRTGPSAGLPYYLTRATSPRGNDIIEPNCLLCHAATMNGQLVIGLGNADSDYTGDFGAASILQNLPQLGNGDLAEVTLFADRVATIAPYMRTDAAGVNPADSFTAALLAHHDAETMAWSKTPLFDVPARRALPESVPPWWGMRKKNAMFYSASGRGDHTRFMEMSALLCIDSVDELRAIDAFFPDVRAYVETLPSPRYPFVIDGAKAATGKTIFEATCSGCHGTYGAGEHYPNRLVPLTEVGTDPALVLAGTQTNPIFVAASSRSFFGELSKTVIPDPPAYIAPPLDGVWATAPYLHNGALPTIELVLNSRLRPAVWTRSFDSRDYDVAAVGWTYKGAADAASLGPVAPSTIYDTSRYGYGNGGHLYGDALTGEQRAAVLEYLKTL